jgi:hypothetical protein
VRISIIHISVLVRQYKWKCNVGVGRM